MTPREGITDLAIPGLAAETRLRMAQAETDTAGLRASQLCLVFLAALAILFTRRPDALTNPQFMAEDGVFYQQAYNWPWRSLPVPIAGYYHGVPRLIGLASLAVPMLWAPLVFNLSALTFQILPILLLLSRRFSALPLRLRLLVSLGYLALPNCQEIHGTVTSLQWHLAALGLLSLIAEPPEGRAGRIADRIVIALCAVSGAFAVLLLPIALLVWWQRRTRASLVSAAILTAGVALLPFVSFLNPQGRPATPLGATPILVAHILGGRVFLSSLIGQHGFDALVHRMSWSRAQQELVVLFSFLGLAVLAAALLRGPRVLRLFVLFATLTLAAALVHPMASYEKPQYPMLALHGGGRYWFFPMMAFLASLGWLAARAPSRIARGAAFALLIVLPLGIVLDWRYTPFADLHWREEVVRFVRSPKGTTTMIPINPPGWSMPMLKR
jgi:hypothetical protein